jgi:regulator of sigma E protease
VDGATVRSWNDFRLKMLDGAIERRNIEIEVTREGQSSPQVLKLDASGLTAGEVEKDFLKTLGLDLQMGEIIVNQVMPAGRAEQAGLKVGDIVLTLNGESMNKATALIGKIRISADQALEFKVKRDGVEQVVLITPQGILENQAPVNGVDSSAKRVGKIGAALQNKVETAVVSFGPIDSVVEGAKKTWDMSIFSLRMMGKMVIGELSLKNLSGPISIADYAGQSARVGWYAYVGFLALISISLGVLNLMPIPVLDGGHLVYYALEAIKGKPLSERFMSLTQKAGVGVVLLMMFVAVFNDLNRLISG